jgi:hypothetical protein
MVHARATANVQTEWSRSGALKMFYTVFITCEISWPAEGTLSPRHTPRFVRQVLHQTGEKQPRGSHVATEICLSAVGTDKSKEKQSTPPDHHETTGETYSIFR